LEALLGLFFLASKHINRAFFSPLALNEYAKRSALEVRLLIQHIPFAAYHPFLNRGNTHQGISTGLCRQFLCWRKWEERQMPNANLAATAPDTKNPDPKGDVVPTPALSGCLSTWNQ